MKLKTAKEMKSIKNERTRDLDDQFICPRPENENGDKEKRRKSVTTDQKTQVNSGTEFWV